jgi:hypothetical protein
MKTQTLAQLAVTAALLLAPNAFANISVDRAISIGQAQVRELGNGGHCFAEVDNRRNVIYQISCWVARPLDENFYQECTAAVVVRKIDGAVLLKDPGLFPKTSITDAKLRCNAVLNPGDNGNNGQGQ